MTVHEQFAEGLALYAMGSLPEGEERLALEAHLEACGACRRELAQLRGDMGLLSVSTLGPAPPERSRGRLMAAIANEPRPASPERSSRQRRWWWAAVPWAVAAAVAIVAGVLWNEDALLRRQLTSVQSIFSGQQEELARAREVVATLAAPESQQVTLVAAKALPQPHGKAFYLRSTGSLIFLASNLPVLPADKIYELWLIPTVGS
ncbi:MAG: anti-sigma factor, partial [Terriglobales bacterium]